MLNKNERKKWFLSVCIGVKDASKVVSLVEGLKKRFPGLEISKFHVHFSPELESILFPKDYDYSTVYRDAGLKNDHYFIPPNPNAKIVHGKLLNV